MKKCEITKYEITQCVMAKRPLGFTLLELIFAIAIVGILAAMALPAFDNQLKNSRLTSNTNLIVGAYNAARSEAINRGSPVKVTDLGTGWAIIDVATGAEINRFEPGDKGITWTPSNFPDVTYVATGFRAFGSASVTLKLCDDRKLGRAITISPAGSTSVDDSPSCA